MCVMGATNYLLDTQYICVYTHLDTKHTRNDRTTVIAATSAHDRTCFATRRTYAMQAPL